MKKILAILKNRWFVSLLGLLAVAVLVWFLGPLIAIAGAVPLAGCRPKPRYPWFTDTISTSAVVPIGR